MLRVSSLVRGDRTRHGMKRVVRWRCASWLALYATSKASAAANSGTSRSTTTGR
jgi:hypothetical protein